MEPVWRPGYGLDCPGFKFQLEQPNYLFSKKMSILLHVVPRVLMSRFILLLPLQTFNLLKPSGYYMYH